MKKNVLLILGMATLISGSAFSQLSTMIEDFETGIISAEWRGVILTNENLTAVENPFASDLITGDYVGKIDGITETMENWCGVIKELPVENMITFGAADTIISLKVYKGSIGNMGLKVENTNGDFDAYEVGFQNTKENEWEIINISMPLLANRSYNLFFLLPDYVTPHTVTELYIDDLKVGKEEPDTTVIPSGISNTKSNSIFVYPTNATNFVTIKGISGEVNIQIIDIQGRIVKSESLLDSRVSVADLTSGMYIITMRTNEGIFSSKFTKE